MKQNSTRFELYQKIRYVLHSGFFYWV